MTIKPFTAGTYATDRNTANLVGLKSRLDGLTTQLSTGKVSDTYGGLGSGRTTSLSAHATLSALDGYDSAITNATTRVKLTSTSVSQIATLADSLRRGLASGGSSTIANTTNVAENSLEAAVDALNQTAAGQYVFGGRSTETPPVASADTILNGDPIKGLAGLKAVIAERKAADGSVSPGTGGLVIPAASGTGVSLSEGANAANRANFGFILGAVTSSNPTAIAATTNAGTASTVDPAFATQPKDGDIVRVTVNQPDGSQKLVDYTARTTPTPGATNEFGIGASPAASAANLKTSVSANLATGETVAGAQSANPPGVSVAYTNGTAASAGLSVQGTPADGDTVKLTLKLRDGTTTTLTLTARTNATAGDPTQFQIDSDPTVTAQNLRTALSASVTGSAATTLSSASTVLATQDFFAGSSTTALAPRRVDAANGGFLSDAGVAAGKTQIWYTGDDTSADPRATATVQLGAGRSLNIGVQANEASLRSVLSGVAALAAESFTDTTSGSTEAARYAALSVRSQTLLGATATANGVQGLASDISLAAKSLSDAKTQNASARSAVQDSLDGAENVSTEEVTVKLLALQTQLQASYQVTSMLSKLTLTNYLT